MDNIRIDLDKITIDPLAHQGGEERWAEEYKAMGLNENEIQQEIIKRKNEKQNILIRNYTNIYQLFEPSLRELYGENQVEDNFYKLVNSFKDGRKLLDFIFSVDFISFIDELPDSRTGLKALFLISFIESLTAQKYISLDNWLKDSANKDVIFKALQYITKTNIDNKLSGLLETYFEKYGAFRKMYGFLNDNLMLQDKYHLLQGITFKRINSKDKYSPICFDEKSSTCQNARKTSLACYGCRLERDGKLLSQAFKKLIRELYNMRSQFVHNAKYVNITIPSIKGMIGAMDCYKVEGGFMGIHTSIKYDNFKKLIIMATINYFGKNGNI